MFEVPEDERPRLKKRRQLYFIGRWLGSLLILTVLLVLILWG